MKNSNLVSPHELNQILGQMDLELLDQVLKNRFEGKKRILDAGCGEGRNSYYFLKQGSNIYGVDPDQSAIRMVKMVARTNQPAMSENFLEAKVGALPFPDSFFDVIFCLSVLHFAENENDFQSMIMDLHRVLEEDGILFLRMIDQPVEGIPFHLDVASKEFVLEYFELLEPYKSVLVEDRSLNVMILKKIRA